MRLLAKHTIAHSGGEKCISLYQGGLTQIPPGEKVDLLVVSAFPNDYVPTSTSLVGALHRIGISVEELSRHKDVDLRHPLSTWLSTDISQLHPKVGFRRILCFEAIEDKAPPEVVGDIFRALLPFALGEPPIQSLAMPVLASGDQRYDPAIMLSAIFQAACHWLSAGLPLVAIKVVVRDEELANRLKTVFKVLRQRHATSGANASALAKDTESRYHFFLSYAHKDSAEVDLLLDRLRHRKPTLRVFRDKLSLNVGQSWQSELDGALETCRQVIAVYSPAYLKSKMCLEEFNMARLRHRESPAPVLTPIYLRDAPLPLYMRTLQFIDCREADRRLLTGAAERLAEIS
ncbi:MAG: toll/interleukin-1 receptor domain-containing protein [Polyangia bacterium]